ncbi:MAG: sulfite exporter TauE/SafE family protein [bacterium]
MLLSVPLTIIVFLVGVLIGGVGIGGVLLVPALKYLGDISLHVAIPACMLSYIVTGSVGAYIYAGHGSINWQLAARVCIGALPGAYFGAYLLPHINTLVLEAGIALLLITSGLFTLIDNGSSNGKKQVGGLTLLFIGFVTGVGSALSGTGGPLLLIPILVWLKVAVLTAIGLSQAIQIPISLMATIGNVMYAEVDFRLGLTLAAIIVGGTVIGAKTVHLMPVGVLKKLVAGLLILVGVLMIAKLLGKIL